MEIKSKEELINHLKYLEDKITTLEANLSTKEEESEDEQEEEQKTEIESEDEITKLFDL